MSASSSTYDIIIFGATGFTGRLCAEYMAQNYPTSVKWAIAGRNRKKLDEILGVVKGINPAANPAIIIADSFDGKAVEQMCAQTKVLATTSGPFTTYGENVIASCAKLGTHYLDITGETPWVSDMQEKYSQTAEQSGAKIVNFAGFDSIPSDLGALMVAQFIKEQSGKPVKSIKHMVGAMEGEASGGTIASALTMMSQFFTQPVKMITKSRDAHMLTPVGKKGKDTVPAGISPGYDSDLKLFTAPWVMSFTNNHVVRKSAAFLDYGPNFTYSEHMLCSGGPLGFLLAMGTSVGFALAPLIMVFAVVPPFKYITNMFLPQPGQGPSKETIKNGHFTITIIGKSDSTPSSMAVGIVKGIQDPGYGETSKMLMESALCLALQEKELPKKSGFLTTAMAMGQPLIQRLRNAGMTFEVK